MLNNFSYRLGDYIGRMIASVFSFMADIANVHNHRDYTSFPHHRYILENQGSKWQKAKRKSYGSSQHGRLETNDMREMI